VSFSTLFDTPFFTGSGGLSDQVPWPWPLAIDGHPFDLDLAHFSWDLPDMMRQSFDSSDRPGEGSFEVKGVWRRIYSDWSLGAGQIYADPAKSSAKDDTRQFTSSLGLDPWTPRQLSMLPVVQELANGVGLTPIVVFALGPWLYLLNGSVLTRTTEPHVFTPVYDTISPAINGAFDVTTDGNTVYVSSVSGIWAHDSSDVNLTVGLMSGAAGTTAGAGQVIQWANGWLLVGKGHVLSSVAADGTMTAVTVPGSLAVTGFQWTAICGAPNAIYAGGGSADNHCIYAIGIDQTTGGLGAATYAAELPKGESLTSLTYYGQIVMVGTSKGFHVAQVASGNALDIGPLIPTPNPVECLVPDANFIWYGWTDYDSTHTGLGRANLGEFTDTLLPAYASDLMTAGPGRVTSVARFAGHTYFTIDTQGIFRESPDGHLVSPATCRFGRLEWGTMAAKTFLGAEIVTEPLHGSFTAVLEDETGKQTPIGGRASPGTTGRQTLLGTGLGTNSNFYDLIVTFERDEQDATTGPILRAITERALPMPTATRTWQLPIVCSDNVTLGDIESRQQDVKEIQAFLLDLRVSGRPVIQQLGMDRDLVVVRSVALPEGQATQWSENSRAVQGTILVTTASAEE
jgi:hypothetical protein